VCLQALQTGPPRAWLREVWPIEGGYRARAAAAADCETLAVMRRQLQQLLEQESPALWRMTAARSAALGDFYAECLSDADVLILVAETSDAAEPRIIGTATARIETGRDVARFGSIEDVWVEPEHRGRGICRALVAKLTEFFQAQGVNELSVGFAHGGTAAELWQRLGFTPAVVIANGDVDTVRDRTR
jgi:ribosomal protein S18 acetylase RimI-like enzyme